MIGAALAYAAPAAAEPAGHTWTPPVVIPGTAGLGEPSDWVGPDGTIYMTAPSGLGGGDLVFKSKDRGATWTQTATPDEPVGGGDSDIVVDSNKTVYQSGLSLACINIAASTNEGQSWMNNSFACNTPVDDRNWIDTYKADLGYLTFGNIAGGLVGGLDQQFLVLVPFKLVAGLPLQSPPVQLPQSVGYQWPGTVAASPKDGTVEVVWNDQGDAKGNSDTIFAARSTDQGQSVQTVTVGKRPGDSFDSFVQVDHDNAGNVYVVWSERAAGNADKLPPGMAAATAYTTALRRAERTAETYRTLWNGGTAVDASLGEGAREALEADEVTGEAVQGLARSGRVDAALAATGTRAAAAAAPDPNLTTAVFLAVSRDGGKTFGPPVKVNTDRVKTAIFPWVVGGDDGRITVVYYGTDMPGASAEVLPKEAQWKVYAATSINATAATPTFVETPATGVFHTGPICTSGTGCASGTRSLLDFFEVDKDADGFANIVYTEHTGGGNKTNIAFVRQTSGLSLKTPPPGSSQATLEQQIVQAVGQPAGQAPSGPTGSQPSQPTGPTTGQTRGPANRPARRLAKLPLNFSRPGGAAGKNRRVLRIAVRTAFKGGLKKLVITLRLRGSKKVLAIARLARLPARKGRVMVLRLKRPLRKGRYVMVATGQTTTGRVGTAAAQLRFR